jgi:hypothetical protein
MTNLYRQAKSSDTTSMKHASMHKEKNRAPRLMKFKIGRRQDKRYQCQNNSPASYITHPHAGALHQTLRCDAMQPSGKEGSQCALKLPKQANSVTGWCISPPFQEALTWRFFSQLFSEGVDRVVSW